MGYSITLKRDDLWQMRCDNFLSGYCHAGVPPKCSVWWGTSARCCIVCEYLPYCKEYCESVKEVNKDG